MRQDKKKTAHNKAIKDNIRALVKTMRRQPSPKTATELASALDKAVKVKFIHKNKAARLKSRLGKLLIKPGKTAQATPPSKRLPVTQ